LVSKESIVYKSAIEVRVIWLNEAILEYRVPKPAYKVRLVDVTETYIDFRILFDDPDEVSDGSKLDVAEVWFRDVTFFVRRSDMAVLSTSSQILLGDIPKQVRETGMIKEEK